jgi:hypothetical protein
VRAASSTILSPINYKDDKVETYIEREWIRVPYCVMMHGPSVENNHSVFGDQLSLINKVLDRNVRSPKPKWIMAPLDLQTNVTPNRVIAAIELYLLDDSVAIGKILLVINSWKSITSNNKVKLLLRFSLYVRIRRNERREPLHNSGGLS